MVDVEKNSKVGSRVLEQFLNLFVTPEIKRRQEAGELEKPLDLRSAQIIFSPYDNKPQVRINSEVRGIGQFKLKPGVRKKKGETIFENEVDGLGIINLTEEDDPDCAHATLVKIGNTWAIAFDFRYNKGLSETHIEAARQFYESAEIALNKEHWAPFIDNLFSASELLARSILLSIPDPKFRNKASHKAIQMKYNRFSDLGNVKTEYCETFNKLSGLRDRARYLKGDVSITEAEGHELLDTIKNMIDDAKSRIDNL